MNLQPTEKKVLELKYKSLPFSKMSSAELKIAASALLIKISFITGWSLYEDPASHGILKEQFELKITESYPNVNEDEMLYAFRQNTTVKDWGKSMNLSLIDEVMIPYLETRFEVSKLEENLTKIEEPAKQLNELNTWRESVQRAFESYLAGKAHYRLWLTEMYDQLVYDDFIPALCYKDFVAEERRLFCEQLHNKIIQVESILEKDKSKLSFHKDLQNQLIEYRNGTRDKEVILISKQKAMLYYFKYLESKDIKKIYVQ